LGFNFIKMTFSSLKAGAPRAIPLFKNRTNLNLLVHGQGVVIVDATAPFTMLFKDSSGALGLKVQFTKEAVKVNLLPSDEPAVDSHNCRGLSDVSGAYYWFSLDSQNQRLYGGIGEARLETKIYSFEFMTNKETYKKLLESLVTVDLEGCLGRRLLRDPVTRNVPLAVKNTNDLTMDDIAAGKYMPKANLSLVAQKLYDCIDGRQFTLNTPDFPNFVKAIEYSIATPGCWCHERLKQKATEFSKEKPNYDETYLRITLGENNGESPGIPYVMEIWPVGHYSPIHNHGGANAVVRVLHGSINVKLFPFLTDKVVPFGQADFKKDDVTWISPTLNQVHQLKNLPGNNQTCITIQCYMYDMEDVLHHDYFDYMDDKGNIGYYEPDSDMEFLAFKETMKEEWSERRRWC
jgi:hypothetical protein